MSYTYAEYVATLAQTLVVPATDPNYLIELPRIIDDAEQRIYRELDLLNTIVRDASGTLTPNNRLFTFPQHVIVSESINVFTPSGTTTNRFPLTPTTREFIDQFFPNDAAPSTPSVPYYYAMQTDQIIVVAPPPDAAYNLEVVGTIRPAPLSATNTTTYLTQYLPDLFFAASLVFGAGYLQNYGAMADNPQSGLSWESHYTSLAVSANMEEMRKKYTSMAWASKSPSILATPPRA